MRAMTVVDDLARRPTRLAARDLAHETPQYLAALQRVRNLGMKLQRVQSARLVGDGGERRVVAGRDHLEPRRRLDYAIAVAHPDIEQAPSRRIAIVLEAVEQTRSRAGLHAGEAEFAMRRRLDDAA